MKNAESFLSAELLKKASLRGKEYAWPVYDIPVVIEAGRIAELLNIGGQLQFRLADGGVCECYWVDVDTYKTVSKDLPWGERVNLAAHTALKDFQTLKNTKDFIKEGKHGFPKYLDDRNAEQAMCFVWYLSTEEEEKSLSLK